MKMRNVLLLWFAALSAKYSSSAAVFVDPQYELVKWTGWGTSIAWFGDVLGGFSDEVQAEIYRALFSPDKLNLNIIRYAIGGTTPGDLSCGDYWTGANSESFRDGIDMPYIWSRDARSRKVLLAAKSHGADTFEAISMSPPAWMTRSGCTKGNPEGAPLHDNFDPENSNAFADYLTEVVKYYHENYKVTFTTIEPFWEASSGVFVGSNPACEGCNMERSTMVEVVKSLYASIRTKNLTFCGISASNEVLAAQELETQKYFTNAGVSSLYNKVNVQWNNLARYADLYTLAERNRHSIWVTDMDYRSSSLQNMTQGLSIATKIIQDMRNLLPSGWVYWEALGSEGASGIVSIPYSNATIENIRFNSGYYAMMQFSQHIRNGFTIIHSSDKETLAAYDSSTNQLVLVVMNAYSEPTTKTLDLRRFASVGNMFAYRTSKVEPHVPIPEPSLRTDHHFTFAFPARSVTTIEINDAVIAFNDDLIKNGDFERIGDESWSLQFGSRDDNGVNGNYVRRGDYSGYLDLAESKLSLVQTVTVSQTRTYYLSAWCAATGSSTIFGVLVNGLQGPEVNVEMSNGYRLYGLSVDAVVGDVLSIYLHSEMGAHTAQIDDVSMH